jgi:hypothetical protein
MPTPRVFGFIHVPKTAGTSFLSGLEARCRRVHRDYASGPSSPLVRAVLYEHPTEPLSEARATLLRKLIADAASDASEPVFLCGHFGYRQYPFSELGVPVITFLREPLERVLSIYAHRRRAHGERRPLRQFVLDGHPAANHQSKMLEGVALDELAFVGITERYEESVVLFNRQSGLDIPALVRNRSDGPGRARILRFGRSAERPALDARLDPETRELILSRNARDVELYRAARELVDARLEEAAVGG